MLLSLGTIAGALAPVLHPVTRILPGAEPSVPATTPAPATTPLAPAAPVGDTATPPPVVAALAALSPSLADLALPEADDVPTGGEPVTEAPAAGPASDEALPSPAAPPVANPTAPVAASVSHGRASVVADAPGLTDRLSDPARRDTLLAGLIRAEQQLAGIAGDHDRATPTITAAEIMARAMAGVVAEAKAEGPRELALIG